MRGCLGKGSVATALVFLVMILCIFTVSGRAQAGELTISSYELVSSVRVGRTTWEYTYRATATNGGARDVTSAVAVGTSAVPGMTVVNGSLSFGAVPIGAAVKSSNTFTIRVNRQYSMGQKDLNWNVTAEYAGARFIPGSDTPAASAQMGPAGGTIQATGGPLNGVKLQIPAGVLQTSGQVSLSYNNGTLTGTDNGAFSGIILSISIASGRNFEQPLIVTVPFNDDGTQIIPMPYYIDSNGHLQPLQLVKIDYVAKEFSFATYHTSLFTWFYEKLGFPSSADDRFSTSYRPGKDGFQIHNFGSIFASDGECFGMTSFSHWYFENKKGKLKPGSNKLYGNLYPEYYYEIAGQYSDGKPMRGQDLIATRAHISLLPQQHMWMRQFSVKEAPLSDEMNHFIIRQAMLRSGDNVFIGLGSKTLSQARKNCIEVCAGSAPCIDKCEPVIGHVVLAYAFNYPEGTISVYDPNYPGDNSRTIRYNSSQNRFEAYDGVYDEIVLGGYGPMSDLAEDFENILADAEAGFHGSADATIAVTSHTSGQTVGEKVVTLSGNVRSGQVLVDRIKVIVGGKYYPVNPDPNAADPVNVDPNNGSFSVAIALSEGINHLRFGTWGMKDGQRIQSYNNLIKGDFTLNYVPSDATPPTLASSLPLSGANNVPVATRTVSFTFSEPMNTSVQISTAISWQGISGGSAPTCTWAADEKILNCTFSSDLPAGTTIRWTLNQPFHEYLMDRAENPLPLTQGSFTTAAPPPGPNGLVAYYPFSGNARDESGNVNHGTPSGVTLSDDVFGKPNSAYYFDGIDDYVDIPDRKFETVTASALVKLGAANKTMLIVDGWTGRENFLLGVDARFGYPQFWAGFHHSIGNDQYHMEIHTKSTTVPQANKYYHVAMTYDDSVLKLYVNGAKEGEITTDKSYSYVSYGATPVPDIKIGTSGRFPGGFQGTIDEVRLYDRALSSAEIRQLYEDTLGGTVEPPAELTLLFEDDFNDGVINPFWQYNGWDVIEANGMISLQQNVTDHGGTLWTSPFPAASIVRVEMRHYMHSGNNYFWPGVTFGQGDDWQGVEVKWLKDSYAPDYCYAPEYYNKVMAKIRGFGYPYGNNCFSVSNLTASDYYDRWIISHITYNTETGDLTLDLNGDGTIEHHAVMPENVRRPVYQLLISGGGWWTGHYHSIDWIKIYTAPASFPQ